MMAERAAQTIASKIAALHKAAAELGLPVPPQHGYVDEGFSGTRLDRPAFDAMPDAAADSLLDVLLVFASDRLTRNEREEQPQAFVAVLSFAENDTGYLSSLAPRVEAPCECWRT